MQLWLVFVLVLLESFVAAGGEQNAAEYGIVSRPIAFSTSDLHVDMSNQDGQTGERQMQPKEIWNTGAPQDPKTTITAYNCVAIGKGLSESVVGTESRLEVIARNIFGDGTTCKEGMFTVRVVELTSARNEDSVQCVDEVDAEERHCTRCGKMHVCFVGAADGACQFAYTPRTAGFLSISVLLKGPLGMQEIQGSPFSAHVDDGGVFLPGISFMGYMSIFMTAVCGATLLLVSVLSVAWQRWKGRSYTSEDDLEMIRLERIAMELESTSEAREQRSRLLAHLVLKDDQEERARSDSTFSSDHEDTDTTPHGPLGAWGGRMMRDAAHGVNAVGMAAGAAWSLGTHGATPGWGIEHITATHEDSEDDEDEEQAFLDPDLGGIDMRTL